MTSTSGWTQPYRNPSDYFETRNLQEWKTFWVQENTLKGYTRGSKGYPNLQKPQANSLYEIYID